MTAGSMADVDRARQALLATVAAFAPSRGDVDAVAAGTVQPDDWSLGGDALRFLDLLVAILRPRSVLELGSGASTCVLGRACAALEPPSVVVAIESDPQYEAQTRAQLDAEGLSELVTLVAAPVVARRCHGRMVPVYLLGDPARWPAAATEPASLVLVDGPPLPLGGREGALYQALHAAEPGCVVILDDSRRDSEREVLVRILQTFDGRVEAIDLLGFPKGLAALLVTAPIGRAGLVPELTPGGGTRT